MSNEYNKYCHESGSKGDNDGGKAQEVFESQMIVDTNRRKLKQKVIILSITDVLN